MTSPEPLEKRFSGGGPASLPGLCGIRKSGSGSLSLQPILEIWCKTASAASARWREGRLTCGNGADAKQTVERPLASASVRSVRNPLPS